MFITLSNASQGAFGFAFWLLGARLYSVNDVGLATTLVTAVILIAYMSLLGFNNTFVRYLPTSLERDDDINTGLILVGVVAAVLAVAYALGAPSVVPELSFVRDSPGYMVGFVVIVAFSTMNLLTDSVFIAYRAAHYNFFVDGVLQGAAKLVLPALLVGMAAFGLFLSSGAAAVVAVLVSLTLMARKYSYRPRPRVSLSVVRKVFRYSGATYVADLLMMSPVLFLPLIVVNRLGPSAGGYYYIALQMANTIFAMSYAVSQSLFAEASYEDLAAQGLVRRSALLQARSVIPLALVLALGSHLALAIFGSEYAAHASSTLAVFALSAPAVALNYWTAVLARIQLKLKVLVVTNLFFGVFTSLLAAAWAGRGLAWVAGAWLLGNLTSGAVRAYFVFRTSADAIEPALAWSAAPPTRE